MPQVALFLLVSLIKVVLVVFILLTAVAYTVWLERKVVGRMQNRWGPTRVGPFGLLQPLADGLKFILKEDLLPPHVNKPLYIAAPIIAVAMALLSISLVPFGTYAHARPLHHAAADYRHHEPAGQAADINIGLLIILGVTSIGVYGIALAGWSSNSKYSLLGGLRASRADGQLRSFAWTLAGRRADPDGQLQPARYCEPPGFRRFLRTGTSFGGFQFFAFFIYLTSAYAETNRIPFDLPEAETELVAGYHTEYSAMKFAMFFMAEYANMVTVACIASLLFLGDGRDRSRASCRRFCNRSCRCCISWRAWWHFSLFTSGCAARCPASVMTN